MKTPSKTKLVFCLVLGGFTLGAAAFLRPYDFQNIMIGWWGALLIAGAAAELDRHYPKANK